MRYISVIVLLGILLSTTAAFAEIKTFDVSVEEPVSRNQSQESVEAFALQKAKRLAVEQAGTYLSTMKVVKQGRLSKAEVTAIASGIVRTEVVQSDAVVKNGQVSVLVKARVVVDTAVLEKQVDGLLKDRSLLKELEDKDRQMRALEDELAQVKGVEVKRLQELNAQAVALEMEWEKRRLFIEEQRLKAQSDMANAQLIQLQEERERAAHFEQIRKEQESARQKELEAIAREQDQIKKAQLENEANTAELSRTAELAKSRWVLIDDRLSAEQAKAEAEGIRAEIARLLEKLDRQHESAIANLKAAYHKQMEVTIPINIAEPSPQDMFESTEEYKKRIEIYKHRLSVEKEESSKKLVQLKSDLLMKNDQLNMQTTEIKINIIKPFVDRLQQLQQQIFIVPHKKIILDLKKPQADYNRFPLSVRYKDKSFQTYWEYENREEAKIFYQTRSYLIGEPIFKLEPKTNNLVDYVFVGTRVYHPGTREKRDFFFISPKPFHEVTTLQAISNRIDKERSESINKVEWITSIWDKVDQDKKNHNQLNERLEGRWKSFNGSVVKYDGNAFIVESVSDKQLRFWVENVFCKNFRKKGNKYYVDLAIRKNKTGNFVKWKTVGIILSENTIKFKTGQKIVLYKIIDGESTKPKSWRPRN